MHPRKLTRRVSGLLLAILSGWFARVGIVEVSSAEPNPQSGRPELFLQTGHTDLVDALAFSPDGKQLATASWDGTAIIWDVETGEKLWTLRGSWGVVSSPAFSPDGKQLAI